MLSSALAAALARRRIHYGWVVVGTTFLTMLVDGRRRRRARRADRAAAARVRLGRRPTFRSPWRLRLLLFGLMGPFAAALHEPLRPAPRDHRHALLPDRGRPRCGSLAMTEVWQLVLLWGVVVGIGTGMTALVLGATVATRWFSAAPRPGHRHAHRQHRHRAARLPAAAGRCSPSAMAGASRCCLVIVRCCWPWLLVLLP